MQFGATMHYRKTEEENSNRILAYGIDTRQKKVMQYLSMPKIDS